MIQQITKQHFLTHRLFYRLPRYFWNGIKYQTGRWFYTPKPLFTNITLTHRYNGGSAGNPSTQSSAPAELSQAQILGIIRDPLFASTEKLGLSGGEATLREDLEEITQRTINILPRVKEVELFTDGLDPDRIVQQVKNLISVTRTKDQCVLSVSTYLLDMGPTHNRIFQVPDAVEKVQETINRLQQLQKVVPFYLSATCVVQPANMYDLLPLAYYARHIDLPLNFIPVYPGGGDENSDLIFSAAQNRELISIFTRDISPHLSITDKMIWQDYFKIINGAKRKFPCVMQRNYVNIDTDGSLRLCQADDSFILRQTRESTRTELWESKSAKNLRKLIRSQYCKKCPIYYSADFSLKQQFFYLAGHLNKNR